MVTDGLFAKTVIDAMDVGLPTITSRSDYTIGPSEKSEDIVSAFNFFKDNPASVREMVDRAREKVRRENTWDSYISRLESLLSRE